MAHIGGPRYEGRARNTVESVKQLLDGLPDGLVVTKFDVVLANGMHILLDPVQKDRQDG